MEDPRADFWHGSDKFESWKKFHTFDGVMTYCHIFGRVKNHINAYISHPYYRVVSTHFELAKTTHSFNSFKFILLTHSTHSKMSWLIQLIELLS